MEDDETPHKRTWCGLSSVLDVNVTDANELPISPPVPRYLEEVLIGLQGGEADTQRRNAESALTIKAVNLSKLLTGKPNMAVPVCTALFWTAVGVVFGRMHSEALAEFRDQLAQSWYLLSLDALNKMPNDREGRDWCLTVMPFVLAQAVYRLFCDAFEEDRKNLIAQAGKLLHKLSLVMHFEVTGFQVTAETVRKTRKKLFLSRVLANPQVDLFESEAAKKRQEKLEATQDHRPLSFGNQDGQALEETQLDHVMQNHTEKKFKLETPTHRKGVMKKERGGILEFEEPTRRVWTPPEDLGVERYERLAENGQAQWGRQLAELAHILGEESDLSLSRKASEPDEQDDFDLESTPQASSPDSSSPSSPKGASATSSPGTKSRPRPVPLGSPRGERSLMHAKSSPALPSSMSFGRKNSKESREPLVREPPKQIKIAGNQVTWPAKGAPVRRPSSPRFTKPAMGRSLGLPAMEPPDDRDVDFLQLESPPSRKRRFPKKKVQTVGKFAQILQVTERERREKEMNEKKARQDSLNRKIAVEPLPKDVCDRELCTTWVSPVLQRIAVEESRMSVLRKTRAESRQCKMNILQSFSMPMLPLRPAKDDIGSAGNSARVTGGRAGTAPQGATRGGQPSDDNNPQASLAGSRSGTRGNMASSPASDSKPGTASNSRTDGFGPVSSIGFGTANSMKRRQSSIDQADIQPRTETRAVGGSREMVLLNNTLPRMASAGGPLAGANNTAKLTLEPPSSLASHTVVHRLESQGDAFRKSTFAEYLKENDVFTGDPKVRFDAKRLRAEEEATLRKAQDLNGPPKRQLRLRGR